MNRLYRQSIQQNFLKLDTDETIQDIAENLGKPKSEIYKMLHSQKFRQTVKNQQDILDSGYDKVAQTLADDFGLKVDTKTCSGLQRYSENNGIR